MSVHFLVYSYFEKGCLKNVHATVPKGNMGYDQYTVPDTEAVEPSILLFSFSIGKTYVHGHFVPFFQISLKKRQLKTTHNTFRDCRVHFFRQPFSE